MGGREIEKKKTAHTTHAFTPPLITNIIHPQ